jgi:hypothetical protein
MGVISSPNHWWQNWSKTHAYVASQMFFPRTPDEIASAIQRAEADQRPLRAVGGGWSFSDASLPGTVTTNRPDVHAIEAIAEALPHTQSFDPSAFSPSIASTVTGMRAPDVPSSLIMHADQPDRAGDAAKWIYQGLGNWLFPGSFRPAVDPTLLSTWGVAGVRPIRNPAGRCLEEADVAGSLVMFDLAKLPPRPSRDWFYNGAGVWSVGVVGDSPFDQGDLPYLHRRGRLQGGVVLSPRAAGGGESLSLLLSRHADVPKLPEPVYLINTRSFVSSLQQNLPGLLSQEARDAMIDHSSGGQPQKFLFHVEAGITISELGELLAHQSPRMSLLAISGSPGATLAGALSSATHGAEFNWPLLVDTVKAVHLVGPGGLQWWIEGDQPIADPQQLRAAYPDIAPERIIRGTDAIGGIAPQDWLNAAIVSLGSVGVIYSVVLQVVPQFGVREVVAQTTWRGIGTALGQVPMPDPGFQGLDFDTKLRIPVTSKAASSGLLEFLLDGSMNGTGIAARDERGNPVNRYADLAINPNRRSDGDFDCWIGNREQTLRLPIDPNPPAGNETGEILKGVGEAFKAPDFLHKLAVINQLGTAGDVFSTAWDLVMNQSGFTAKIGALTRASDVVDVGLDTFLTPTLSRPDGPEVAQVLLTGLLSGLLGTANCDRRSDKTGVNVGALGFPGSGVMGTGLEIALAPADAFSFLMTEILDRVDELRPFLGYVSIRVCSTTKTLMGMQQFGDATHPCSVMIEVVAFASDNSRQFIHDLQARTLARIHNGLDAMLHWGLENEQVNGGHLRSTMALRRPARSGLSKLDTFKAMRALVQAAAPAASRVFDNGFTDRLWLSSKIAEDDPYTFRNVLLHTQTSAVIPFWNQGNGPMRIAGVYADGDFRTTLSYGTPSRPANLTIGPLPSAATPKGDFFELPVTFEAQGPGPHEGTLTIVTHADIPDSIRIVRVRLHAQVEAFAVSLVQPPPFTVLDLGAIELGNYSTTQISVHSDSTMNAWLDSCELSAAEAAGEIGIVTTGAGPIPPGQTSSYSVFFEPAHVGAFESDLTLTFSDRVSPPRYSQQLTFKVVGVGVGVQAELSPGALDFGLVGIASESAPLPITLRNAGQHPLIVTGTLIGSDFRLIGPRPTTVAAGAEEELNVVFRPGHGGFLSSSFSISSNSARPPVPVLLHGVGLLQALLTATPASLLYAATPVGSESEESLVVTNAGAIPVELGTLTVTGLDAGDFRVVAVSRQRGSLMRPEETCEIRVAFAPGAQGGKTAILELSHDGATSPLQVVLQGDAVIALELVPSVTELDFGGVEVGTKSKQQKIVLTNTTTAPLKITAVAIAGSDAKEFAFSQRGAADVLEPGEGRTIGVSAQPGAMGLREADLIVETERSNTVVPLRAVGLGVSVEWSAAVIEFYEWKVGVTSERHDAYIHNAGNETLVVSLVDATGDFTVEDLTPQYMSIPPHGDKMFWLWFKPTAAGARQGSLDVHFEGPGATQSLALSGVGV